MKKLFLISMLLIVNLLFSQLRNDFNISKFGDNPCFDIDNNGIIHIVWGGSEAYYAAIIDSGNFLYQPRVVSESLYMGRFPTLEINNDLIAISWSSKHKPPTTDFNSTITMKILKDGADFSSAFEVNDSFGDAERSKPTMFWLDDSTMITAWMGNGSLSVNSQSDIYSQKVILNNTSLKKKFVSDKPLNDYNLSLNDANPQIIKTFNSGKYLTIYTAVDENNNSKIMCSEINSELEILSNKVLVNLPNNDFPCSPKIFSTASGLVLIWTELNGSSNDVYVQEFTEQLQAVGEK